MKVLFPDLNSSRFLRIISVLIPVSFVIIYLLQQPSLSIPIQSLLSGSDDWNYYARNALAIENGDFLMRTFNGLYEYPGSFLYNYFIAMCLTIFGGNVLWIYILQHLLLGISVVILFVTFREDMQPRTRVWFLILLLLFAVTDVARYYSGVLLSENIAIFFLSLFLFFMIKAMKSNQALHFFLASLFLVLMLLTRPNLFPYGCMFVLFSFLFHIRKKKITSAITFSIFMAIGISAIAIRNYLVCGRLIFLPALGTHDAMNMWNNLSVGLLMKKLAFMFGFLPALSPEYNIRPHWMLLWVFYLIYIFCLIGARKKVKVHEWLIHLFVFIYALGSVLLVTVNSYGFRAFVPLVLVVLPYSTMAIERIISGRKRTA